MSEEQLRRSSDSPCPDWIHQPLKLVMEKLQKLDEVINQQNLMVYQQQVMQQAIEKLAAKDAVIAEVVLKQAKQDTGLKIIVWIATMLFPIIITWNTMLQQKIEYLQTKIITLEAKK